jgi:hypothetical protein
MFRRNRIASTDALLCSFCHKSQDVVAKLISSPSDYPRAYICDACIAICNSILADERIGSDDGNVDRLLVAVRRWLEGPLDDPAALGELRKHAEQLFGEARRDASLPKDPGAA